jgi:predicted double-glycine peptidase
MEDNVLLKKIDLILIREWFESLDEQGQNAIMSKYETISDYLGLELNGPENPLDDLHSTQEFKIVNLDLWNEAKSKHIFLMGETFAEELLNNEG